MASFLGEELFGGANQTSGALLLDLILLDQAGFLRLDNLLSGSGAGLRGPATTFSKAAYWRGYLTNFLGATAGLDFLSAPCAIF